MSEIAKDTFYKERLYQLSVTSWGDDEKQTKENRRLKELSKHTMSEEVTRASLGTLGKTAHGSHYAFLSFNASNNDIYTLGGIENFIHLQYIDVSHNNLVTVKPLSKLKYITFLNVSHNNLTKLLDFKEIPYNLEEVIASHNQISVMKDLREHKFLRKIDLSHNLIEKIEGLHENKDLSCVKLAYNKISIIEGLDNLNIMELDLMGNHISHLTGLNKLPFLRKLNLSSNRIVKLKGLVHLPQLRELKLSDNLISRVRELYYLQNLIFLSDLDLCFNAVQDKRFYRYQVLYRLPGLRVLDGVATVSEEFVKAENLYGQDLEDRKRIFYEMLPEEEFIDRRINIADLIEPETESDNEEDLQFTDTYDHEGTLVRSVARQSSQRSLSKNKSHGAASTLHKSTSSKSVAQGDLTNTQGSVVHGDLVATLHSNASESGSVYDQKTKSLHEKFERLKANSRSQTSLNGAGSIGGGASSSLSIRHVSQN